MNQHGSLSARRDELIDRIGRLGDFRPGNLLQAFRKCGQPSCHCAREGDPGHPGWQLTRKVKGKTVTRRIPWQAVELTQAHVEEYRNFRQLLHELIEVSESLCDGQVQSHRKKKR